MHIHRAPCSHVDGSAKVLLLAVLASLIAPLIIISVLLMGRTDVFDIVIQAVLLFTIIPLIAMGAYMWATGKGAMLISGYNTSPQEVRDLMDSTALARFVGKLLVISLTIMLASLEALMLADAEIIFWILLLAGMAIIIYGAYYSNTGGRFLKEGVTVEDMRAARKVDRKTYAILGVLGVIVVVVVIVLVLVVSGSGSVSASVGSESVHVTAPFVDQNITYSDISSVELRDHFDDGRRVGGLGGTEVNSGRFRNDELGNYILARYNAVESCIVVHHTGGTLVFNVDTVDGTVQLYDYLQAKL